MAERPPPGSSITNALFLALILITAGLFLIGLTWVALPLFAVMLILATIFLALGIYRAPEDAVGIVYSHILGHDYLAGFVRPRGFTYIVPFLQRVKEVHTRTRSVEIHLSDVLTRDQKPVSVRALFLFRVRADRTDEELRHELATFTDERWSFIVYKMGNRALQQAVRSYLFDDLFHPEAYDTLGERARAIVTPYIRPRGIEMMAVSIQDLRPGKGMEESVHKAAGASHKAEALRKLLSILIDAMGGHPYSSRDLLAILLLVALLEQGSLPPLFMSLPEGDDLEKAFRLLQLLQFAQSGGGQPSRGNGKARDDGSPRGDGTPATS